MKDCIFCKIIDKEIPNYTVYEDNHVLAFLDIQPHAKGHTVIIPKVHAETIFDLNEELQKHFFPAIKTVMEKLNEILNPDGFNVGWNHLAVGGQVVPHLHVHVLPRFENDGGGNIHSIIKNPGDKTVEEISELFK